MFDNGIANEFEEAHQKGFNRGNRENIYK